MMMLVTPTQGDVIVIFVPVIFHNVQNVFNCIPHSVWGSRGKNSFWIISLLFLREAVMMMMMMMTSVFFLMMTVTTTLDVVAIYVHVMICIAPCVVMIHSLPLSFPINHNPSMLFSCIQQSKDSQAARFLSSLLIVIGHVLNVYQPTSLACGNFEISNITDFLFKNTGHHHFTVLQQSIP